MNLSIIIILIISPFVSSLRILVYCPAFAASHTNFMARLADTLTDAGHNVTFFVPIAEEKRRNLLGVRTTKDVYFVEQDEEMRRNIVAADKEFDLFWRKDIDLENAAIPTYTFGPITTETCANLMRNRRVFEEMKGRKYDVAIAESFQACGLGYFHALGIDKVIISSTCAFYDNTLLSMGEPIDTSHVPSLFSPHGEAMDLNQRVDNYQILNRIKDAFAAFHDNETAILRKYLGDDIPNWRNLIASASIHFTNSIPFLDFPRLEYPKTIPIGGISVDMNKIRNEKLTKEWNDILDRRSKTMLISFGSMTRSIDMPEEYRMNILNIIKKEINVTFIWKYETNDTQWANGVDNVIFSQWVPQLALLNDDRLTAFLTHGGLGSSTELAYTGKPSVMIPLFGDQSRNAHMMARHNMSIVLEKKYLGNVGILEKAIHDILYDTKYTENVRRITRMIEKQPLNPKDIVVKYTEFVGEYGPLDQMTPSSLKMNMIERYNIDVFIIVNYQYVIIVIISLLSLIIFIRSVSLQIVRKNLKIE